MAGEQAIAAAGIDRADIGLLIDTLGLPRPAGAVERRRRAPPPRPRRRLPQLRRRQRLPRLRQRRCTSPAMLIDAGQIDYALIVDGEGARQLYDNTIDRLTPPAAASRDLLSKFATLTLGSGAAAMVLGRTSEHPEGHRLARRHHPRRDPAPRAVRRPARRRHHRRRRPARRRHRARRRRVGQRRRRRDVADARIGTSSTRCPRSTRTRWPRSSASTRSRSRKTFPPLRQHRPRGDPDHARRRSPTTHAGTTWCCAWASAPA